MLICQGEMNCHVGSATCIDELSINSKESLKSWFRCRHPFHRHVPLGDESYPCFLVWQADGAEGATPCTLSSLCAHPTKPSTGWPCWCDRSVTCK